MFFAIGEFVGAFAISLGIAAIWLLISMAIPPLRRKPTVSYGIAMAIALLVQFVSLDRTNPNGWVAAILCVALLYWQMGRAKRKLAEKVPNT